MLCIIVDKSVIDRDIDVLGIHDSGLEDAHLLCFKNEIRKYVK